MPRRPPLVLLLVLVLALVRDSSADTIFLRNGRTLEGLIAREGTNGITLNVGLGEVFIRRSQIESVRRSSAEQSGEIRAGWEDRYFDHPLFVPPSFREVASQLETLDHKRRSALDARGKIEDSKRRVASLRDAIHAHQAELIATHRALGDSPKPEAMRKDQLEDYNRGVRRANDLQGAILVKTREMAESQAQAEQEQANINHYIHFLRAFDDLVAGLEQRATNATPRETAFLARTRKRVDDYSKDLRRVDLPFGGEDLHAVLDVTINGARTGRFLLDTGATRVVLSRAFADLLHLPAHTNQPVQVVLADGREIDAQGAQLESVEAAGARAEDVAAVVVPDAPAAGLDGLLGMSFLREFNLQYDPVSRRVTLVEFAPAAR